MGVGEGEGWEVWEEREAWVMEWEVWEEEEVVVGWEVVMEDGVGFE